MKIKRAGKAGAVAAMVLAATMTLPLPTASAATGDWIDTTFGDHGVRMLGNAVRGAVVAPDAAGRFYAAGSPTLDTTTVTRVSTEGQVDSTFAAGGRSVPGHVVQLQPNAGGGVTVVTRFFNGAGVVVSRLTDAGDPDPQFGVAGSVPVLGDIPTSELTTLAVLDRAGGGLLVVIRRNTGLSYLIGLTSTGAVDTGWVPAGPQVGVLVLPTSLRDATSDGDAVVLLGTDLDPVTAHPYLMRLTPDGSPDLTFGPGGQLALPGLDVVNPTSLTAAAGAYFVVGAVFTDGVGASMKMVKVLPSGVVDGSFGTGGVAGSTPRLGCSVVGFSLAANAEHVFMGGYLTGAGCLPNGMGGAVLVDRFTPAGVLDTAYGTAGELRIPSVAGKGLTGTPGINTLLQQNGQLVVSARFAQLLSLFRLRGDEAPPAAGSYVPVAPTRILDTRFGNGAPTGAVVAGGSVDLQVTGRGGVPSDGVGAVVLNVTVTQPTTDGNIVVFPTGSAVPLASNLNFVPGQTIPNLVTVKAGDGGLVTLRNNSAGTVQLVADVAGFYRSGAASLPGMFTPVSPVRILDTRIGTGAPAGPVAALGSIDLQVAGSGGLPVDGVGAVVLNVTVTQPGSDGNVVVFPAGESVPLASNLNFVPGQTIPNLVTVRVGAGGRVTLRNNSAAGSVQLVADVAGYYLAGTAVAPGAFVPIVPRRLLDTRGSFAVPAGRTVDVPTANTTVYYPAAIVMNVTVTQPTWDGSVVAFPRLGAVPLASNLNFVPGQTIPNLVIVMAGQGGQATLRNNSVTGTIQLIADVSGYFLA